MTDPVDHARQRLASSFGFQYYRRMQDNDFDHVVPGVPGRTMRHPAFIQAQHFTTDDFNVRLTLRPIRGLTLVSRYDFQLSTVESEMLNLPLIESGKITSHIFSQSITWSPLARLYLQATGHGEVRDEAVAVVLA
jgi:hypothetical protein